MRREMVSGLDRVNATTSLLQRARVTSPQTEMWEAAETQWAWRQPRPSDDLALPVWFDSLGPVAAAGLTAERDGTWQVDVFAVPSTVGLEEIWTVTLDAAAEHAPGSLDILVFGGRGPLADLAAGSGFTGTEGVSGTAWMNPAQRPPVVDLDGFTVVDRASRREQPHPMIPRNGEQVESRLSDCSLYDPALDLAVVDADGAVAGYALFWFDSVTYVGVLEPMRVHDAYQRRGLARMLLSHGLDRLVRKGAHRLKVGFESERARQLYLGAGFVQTSVDRHFVRPAA